MFRQYNNFTLHNVGYQLQPIGAKVIPELQSSDAPALPNLDLCCSDRGSTQGKLFVHTN